MSEAEEVSELIAQLPEEDTAEVLAMIRSLPEDATHIRPRTFYPQVFTEYIGRRICERLIVGESIKDICCSGDRRYPSLYTFAKWIASNEDFRHMYHEARKVAAEIRIDEIFEIADDSSDDYVNVTINGEVKRKVDNEAIQRSRVRIDTRKWYASKMLPKLYGDVETVKHELPGELTKALQAAANRDPVLPSRRTFEND